MNTARIVVLAIALGAGGIAAYLASGSDNKPAPAAPVAQLPTVDVLVAKGEINLGQTVKPEDLQWQTWPTASASANFIKRTDRPDAPTQLAGAIARGAFMAGEPIRDQKLVKSDSGFMAAILPAGMRAVSTELAPETGAGGFILPNDRVDVLLTQHVKNMDSRGNQQDIVETKIVLRNVRVLAIDQAPKEKDGQNSVIGKTVTLELKPEQATALAASRQAGTLSLALRSIADANASEETVEAPQKFTQSVSIVRFGIPSGATHADAAVTMRTDVMKCGAKIAKMRTSAVRALSFSAVAAFTLNPVLAPVVAADYRPIQQPMAADGQMNARFLSLGIGKSIVIDLPRDIKDVLVADPKIANAVVRSSQRAYIIGAAIGQTNIVFFDAAGQQIAAYDIAVKRDLNGVRAALKQMLPNSDIQIDGVADGVVLTGTAATPLEAQQAADLAGRLAGGADKVVNSITVRGRDQVMLKVTVAEVSRQIIKQLGIDLSANLTYGTAVVNFNNSNPFTAQGGPLVGTNALTTSFGSTPSVTSTIRAMESAGVIRTLAEPNLTAISGESATFIAGGEFPIPAGYSCDPTTHVCTTQISYKKFGVSLNFTPVVLTEGRISLHVMTEVSELSNDNSVTLSQAISSSSTNSIVIPSIKTRRAETTLEIPSGGAMAMAGLIQDQTKQAINGMPGLMQLPILGSLFRSRDYVNNQTELMVLVTPYIVRAVAQKDLSRPDDGFTAVSDPQADLLGNINRIYGVPGRTEPARSNYRGQYGFITD